MGTPPPAISHLPHPCFTLESSLVTLSIQPGTPGTPEPLPLVLAPTLYSRSFSGSHRACVLLTNEPPVPRTGQVPCFSFFFPYLSCCYFVNDSSYTYGLRLMTLVV